MTTLEEWKAHQVSEGYSPHTIRARASCVRLVADRAGVEPHELARAHVLAYLSGRVYAPWTRLKYLSHLRAWAAFAGIGDPTAGVRRPRAPSGLPRPVSEAQLARLLLAARPGRERAWIVLGAFCGLRSFESAKVAAEDLEQVPGGWALRVAGKGGKVALIPVPDIVLEELQSAAAAVDGSGPLWPGATPHTVQRAVASAGQRAGLAVSSHQLRHRYGTAFYAATRDLLRTAKVMRHASTATTEGYALVAMGDVHDVVNGLPGASRSTRGARRGHDRA